MKNVFNKKSKQSFKGYPIATVICYGPDSKTASKVVVGIILKEDSEPAFMQKWFSDDLDVRSDPIIQEEVLNFIQEHKAKSVAISDGILGCPHEEGIDYPEGEICPKCPYWSNRDRCLDEVVQ